MRGGWTIAGAVVVAAGLLLPGTPARAEWLPSGLPLATGPTGETRPVGLTGSGGTLHAFWVDLGPASHVLRAQRLTFEGTLAPGWPAGGRGIVTPPAAISTPRITSDGTGGAILAWYDYRSGGGPRGIYAVRADAEAAIVAGWSAAGTPICTTSNPQGLGPLNDLVQVCGDGADGAFVAWTDARNTPPLGTLVYDVFAHHVLADGSLDPAWPAGGRALTTGSGYKYPHALVADDGGGFWLATEQSDETWRTAVTHHDGAGGEIGRWTSPSFASRVTAVGDGGGGSLVAWRDCRDCMGGSDAIYAIRLGAGAVPASGWAAGGVAVGESPGDDDLPVIVATGDGAAIIAWLAPGNPLDAYVARRVEANGSFAFPWHAGGLAFAVSADILSGWPLIAPDGDGGAMFAFRRNTPNLFGSRVTAAGWVPAAFPDTGLSLCSLSGDQFPATLVSDGINGAFVLWEDRRDQLTNQVDLYVTRFTREGEVGSTAIVDPPAPPRGLAMSAPRPNPASGLVTFELSLVAASHTRVEVLDLGGRRIAVLLDGEMGAGTHALRWDGYTQARQRASAGLYLVRARTADATLVRRIVRLP